MLTVVQLTDDCRVGFRTVTRFVEGELLIVAVDNASTEGTREMLAVPDTRVKRDRRRLPDGLSPG